LLGEQRALRAEERFVTRWETGCTINSMAFREVMEKQIPRLDGCGFTTDAYAMSSSDEVS